MVNKVQEFRGMRKICGLNDAISSTVIIFFFYSECILLL